MEQPKRTYLAWLNNAYAMEISAVRMYDMHAKDADRGLNAFPETAKRLRQHKRESEQHAKLMQSCLERAGGTPILPKTIAGEAAGFLLGFSGDITIDKIIMNNLTDYGSEHFEIAGYYTLIAAAKSFHDTETVMVCQKILAEERAMAAWLEAQLGPVAQEFLRRVTP